MKDEKLKKWFFWIGILIVVFSHIYILTSGLPADQITTHAVVNLVAASLIGFAWYK